MFLHLPSPLRLRSSWYSLRTSAKANTLENFRFAFQDALEGIFIDRIDQNEEITAKFMNEDTFRKAVTEHLLKEVYEEIRTDAEADE